MFHILYIQWVDHVSGNMWILAMEGGPSSSECVSVSERRAVEQCSLQFTHLAYTVDFLCLSWVTSCLFCKSWKERHWHTWGPSACSFQSPIYIHFAHSTYWTDPKDLMTTHSAEMYLLHFFRTLHLSPTFLNCHQKRMAVFAHLHTGLCRTACVRGWMQPWNEYRVKIILNARVSSG